MNHLFITIAMTKDLTLPFLEKAFMQSRQHPFFMIKSSSFDAEPHLSKSLPSPKEEESKAESEEDGKFSSSSRRVLECLLLYCLSSFSEYESGFFYLVSSFVLALS